MVLEINNFFVLQIFIKSSKDGNDRKTRERETTALPDSDLIVKDASFPARKRFLNLT